MTFEVVHVEDVDDLDAVGGNLRERQVAPRVRKCFCDHAQQPEPVLGVHLDDRMGLGGVVVDDDSQRAARPNVHSPPPGLRGLPAQLIVEIEEALQGRCDVVAYLLPAILGNRPVRTAYTKDLEGHTVRPRVDLGIVDVDRTQRKHAGYRGEQSGPVVCNDDELVGFLQSRGGGSNLSRAERLSQE